MPRPPSGKRRCWPATWPRALGGAIVLVGLCLTLEPGAASAADGRTRCKDGPRFVVKVVKGDVGCSNARRALRGFMDNVYASDPLCVPGKCRRESPRRWNCQLENTQLTEAPGRTAKCKRERDGSVGVLIFLGESVTGARLRGFWQDCGEYGGVGDHLEAHDVRCGRARSVMTRFFIKAQEQGPRVRVAGFRCRGRVTDSGDFNVKCKRTAGRGRVWFKGALG